MEYLGFISGARRAAGLAVCALIGAHSVHAGEVPWDHWPGGLPALVAWVEDVQAMMRIGADPVMRAIVCRVPYTDVTVGAIVRATRIPTPRLMRAAHQLRNMGLIALEGVGLDQRIRPASESTRARMREWAYHACATDDGCRAPRDGTATETIAESNKKRKDQEMPGFDEPVALSVFYDSPNRVDWQKPDKVLELLDLKKDTIVADIGSGTGYFTLRLARAVPRGRVYAIDHEPNMLIYLGDRVVKENIDNVVLVPADNDDPHIPDDADVVLSVNAIPFIETEDRKRFIANMYEEIREGTRVVVIDWNDRDEVPPKMLADEMVAAGFRLLRHDKDMLSKQYVLVLSKPVFQRVY